MNTNNNNTNNNTTNNNTKTNNNTNNNTKTNNNTNNNTKTNNNKNNNTNMNNLNDEEYQKYIKNKKMEFDTKWDSLLQDYNDNYISYLTKKVRDNNDDSKLREKIVGINKELVDIIELSKKENDTLIIKINKKQKIISNQDTSCENYKNSLEIDESNSIKDNITLNKKLKNMIDTEESLRKFFFTLICIIVVIVVVNIAFIILSLKKKIFIY